MGDLLTDLYINSYACSGQDPTQTGPRRGWPRCGSNGCLCQHAMTSSLGSRMSSTKITNRTTLHVAYHPTTCYRLPTAPVLYERTYLLGRHCTSPHRNFGRASDSAGLVQNYLSLPEFKCRYASQDKQFCLMDPFSVVWPMNIVLNDDSSVFIEAKPHVRRRIRDFDHTHTKGDVHWVFDALSKTQIRSAYTALNVVRTLGH